MVTHLLAVVLALAPLGAEVPEAARPAAEARSPGEAAPSVYRVHLPLDGPLIGVSASGMLLAGVLAPELIRPRCPCDPGEVRGLDRVALGASSGVADVASTATAVLAIAAPAALEAWALGPSPALLEDLTVYTEALTVSGALVTTVKYLVQRPLPLVYTDPQSELASRPGGYRAFYSGHTALTVTALSAAAMTWTLRRGPAAWPWVVVALGGGSVAVERVLSGRHFPSDVVVGALAGLGVGVLVPWLHARRETGVVALQPAHGGLQLTWGGVL